MNEYQLLLGISTLMVVIGLGMMVLILKYDKSLAPLEKHL